MARPKARTGVLREDCVREALAIIEKVGVEGLSLRDVARRLKVSHQAPYKHFSSRDHVLAEIVSRAFASFAQYLDARPKSDDPHEDLAAMGRAYLEYANKRPVSYRLMFGTPLPEPARNPEMIRSAQHAFSLLKACLVRMRQAEGRPVEPEGVELDALFVWATMHGLSGIVQTSALRTLNLPPKLLTAGTSHVLARIGSALSASDPSLPARATFSGG